MYRTVLTSNSSMSWFHDPSGNVRQELYLYHNPYIGDLGAQAWFVRCGNHMRIVGMSWIVYMIELEDNWIIFNL